MRKILRITLCLSFAGLLSCSQESEQYIMTVNCPIPASALGITLSHEHVLVDFIGADSTGYHRWDKQEVVNTVMPYLEAIQEYQVSTLVECTPAYLGRDPWILKTLSKKTGMHLVTNTGFYGAHSNRFIPAKILELTAEELSQIWVNEFENGIDYFSQLESVSLQQDVASIYEEKIEAETVQSILDKLPEKYKAVLILYYMEDNSYQNIADMLAVPLGTVMSRLSRARQIMKKALLRLTINQSQTKKVVRFHMKR